MSIKNRYFEVQFPTKKNHQQNQTNRKSVLLEYDENTKVSQSIILFPKGSAQVSNYQKHPREPIKSMVQQKIEQLTQSNKHIDNQYIRFIQVLKNRELADVMFQNQVTTIQEKRQKLIIFQNVMKNVLEYEEEDLNSQRTVFLQKNGQIEEIISQQMENLEAHDRQLCRHADLQEKAICRYEKAEKTLKQLLMSKAEIEQIEEQEDFVKDRVVQVRKVRERIQSLKDKKVEGIQKIVKDLEILNDHRTKIIDKINQKYFQIADFTNQRSVIDSFVSGISELKDEKEKQQSDKKKSYKSDERGEVRSRRNSQQIIQSQYESAQNKSGRAIHMLQTSSPPSTFSLAQDEDEEVVQITKSYYSILEAITKTEEQHNEFLQNKMKKYEHQCSIKILERVYFEGIIEIPEDITKSNYVIFLNEIVSKCIQYLRILQIKLRQREVLNEKIQNIRQTKRIFCDNICKTRQEDQTKAKLYAQIHDFLTKLMKEDRSKNIEKQKDKLVMKRAVYEKELEDYAETSNLTAYKETKAKITMNIQQLQKLQKQSQETTCKQPNKVKYFLQVEKIMSQSIYSSLTERIRAATPADTLAKTKKRLMPI